MNSTITFKRSHLTIGALVLLAAFLLSVLSGCAKFIEPFQDAPVSGHDVTPARILDQPDGFSNAAEKCDGYGHLLITTYHGDKAYAAVTVINDPRCGSLQAPLPFGPGR